MENFLELNNEQMLDIDGGVITLTIGGWIAVGCVGAGFVAGLIWG